MVIFRLTLSSVEFRVYKVKLDGELIELQILDVTGSRLIRNTFDGIQRDVDS